MVVSILCPLGQKTGFSWIIFAIFMFSALEGGKKCIYYIFFNISSDLQCRLLVSMFFTFPILTIIFSTRQVWGLHSMTHGTYTMYTDLTCYYGTNKQLLFPWARDPLGNRIGKARFVLFLLFSQIRAISTYQPEVGSIRAAPPMRDRRSADPAQSGRVGGTLHPPATPP